MNPFKFFNHVYLLNLPERKDRLAESIANFKNYEIDNYEVFEATKVVGGVYEHWPSKRIGQIGCALSFCRMIDDAIDKDYDSVVFLEDDFEIMIDPPSFYNKVKACFEELPSNWDQFYLGANVIDHFTHKPLENYSANLLKLNSAYALHSVAISKAGLHNIRSYFSNNGIPWSQQMIEQYEAIDVFFAQTFHPNNNCYIVKDKLLALQRPDFSSIESGFMDFSDLLVDRFNYFKSII